MRTFVAALVIMLGALIWWVIAQANSEQAGYDACWAKGGVQVKTVKFSNGTVCVDRSALIEEDR